MKNISLKLIVGFLSVLIIFTACDKYLDIEPQQSVSAELVYSNNEGVQNALHGAYSVIATSNFYAGNSVYFSDLLGNTNDLTWIGTFVEWRQTEQKNFDTNNGFVSGTWSGAYRAINIINNILANLAVVRESDRNRVEGEAKFIRGIMYFELVRFYALPYGATGDNSHMGVPLVITPTTGINESSYPPRATVAAIYTQILADLIDAKTKLTLSGPGANAGRATSTTASAFLARVYMSMKDWPNAATEANRVITATGFELRATPRAAFNNDAYTSEDVFMIRQNATSHAGQANAGLATHFASLPGLGRGDVYATGTHLARYEGGDLRAAVTINPAIKIISDVPTMFYHGVGSSSGNTMTSKWGKHDAFINVVRLAEMILTRAEANFMKGGAPIGGVEPFQDLNSIRLRANATLLVGAGDVTLAVIQSDRIKELSFEGHRLHDIRRWSHSVVPATGTWAGQTILWNDGRLVLPIPQREMDTNPNLIQNPAYVII